MKWIKHTSGRFRDPDIRRLVARHGIKGYGMYWYIIEQVTKAVELPDLTFQLYESVDLIAEDLKIAEADVEIFLGDCVELGILVLVGGVYAAPSLKDLTDEYTQKVIRKRVKHRRAKTPDNVRTMSDLIDRHKERFKDKKTADHTGGLRAAISHLIPEDQKK